MKRVRRMLGIWDTGKVALGMLALLALWGVGELEQTEKAVTAVLWGGFLGLLSLSFLGAARRQRQYAACAPGRVVLRSWRGREQEITAGAVGEILFTGTCLRLLDLRGRRLGQIAWGQPPAADCWGRCAAGSAASCKEPCLGPGGGLRFPKLRRSNLDRGLCGGSAGRLAGGRVLPADHGAAFRKEHGGLAGLAGAAVRLVGVAAFKGISPPHPGGWRRHLGDPGPGRCPGTCVGNICADLDGAGKAWPPGSGSCRLWKGPFCAVPCPAGSRPFDGGLGQHGKTR